MNATKSLVIVSVLCAAVTCSAKTEVKTVKQTTIIDYAPTPKRVVWFRWFWIVLP